MRVRSKLFGRHWRLGVFLLGVIPRTALASSDSCGDSSAVYFVTRPSLDVCSNDLSLLDPYNDSRGNLQLLLKAFVEPKLPQKSAGPEFSMENELKTSGVTLKEYPKLPGATTLSEGVCVSNTSERESEFAHEVLAAGIGKDEAEKLISLRVALGKTCGGKKAFSEWLPALDPDLIRLESSPTGQDWFSYLKNSYALYHSDVGTAAQGFSALRQSSQPWLAEVSTYLSGRSLLVQSQEAWDGYWIEGKEIDKDAAERAKAALLEYLQKYPNGRYRHSAKGLLRRAARLLGRQDDFRTAIFSEFREAIEKGSRDELESFQNELEVYLSLWNTEVDFSVPLLAAESILMSSRRDNAQENVDANASLLEALNAHVQEFSVYPGLHEFLRLSLLFSLGRHEEVVQSLPQGKLTNELIPRSSAFLQAQALEQLKRFDEAFALYRQLRDLEEISSEAQSEKNEETEESEPNPNLESMRARMEMALLRNRLRARAFLDLSRSSEGEYPALRPVFLQLLGEKSLTEILADEKSTPRNKEFAATSLLYQYLLAERFAEFVKLYEHSAEAVQKEFEAIQGPIAILAKKPKDAHSLLALGRFHENFDGESAHADVFLYGSGWTPKTIDKSAHPSSMFFEFFDTEGFQGFQRTTSGLRPLEYYRRAREAAQANPKDHDLQAEILHYMIYCFRWSSCYGLPSAQGVSKKERLGWFQELKKKYKDTEWSENTEYYF